MLTSGGIKLLVVLTVVQGALSGCGCSNGRISCKDVLAANPTAKSGPYKLTDVKNNVEYYAYCDMNSPCGGKGWTRIADVNTAQKDTPCPDGLRDYTFTTPKYIRTCERSTGGCSSAYFSSRGIKYSEVCGRIVAYQYASPDAFQRSTANTDIDKAYVDGISITRGFPRTHVWTLVVGQQGTVTTASTSQCPCNSDGNGNSVVPTFVGDDYYCESGVQTTWSGKLFVDDPLFDNKDCGTLETACCNKGIIPYFYKDLTSKSDDDVELRICADEGSGNEDTCITEIELYVR